MTAPQSSWPESPPLFWRAAFWVSFVLILVLLFGLATLDIESRVYDWVSVVALASTLIPVYGVAYHCPVFSALFWKLYFCMNAAVHLVLPGVLLLSPEARSVFDFKMDIAHYVGVVYGLVILYANYQYAFRRPQIWEGAAERRY